MVVWRGPCYAINKAFGGLREVLFFIDVFFLIFPLCKTPGIDILNNRDM